MEENKENQKDLLFEDEEEERGTSPLRCRKNCHRLSSSW